MNDGGGGGSKKEMTLRNIYDIALTAIAFLSFGLFALQVIMCITLVTHLILLRCFGIPGPNYFSLFFRRKRTQECQ